MMLVLTINVSGYMMLLSYMKAHLIYIMVNYETINVISGGAFGKQCMLVSMHGLMEWINGWLVVVYYVIERREDGSDVHLLHITPYLSQWPSP